MALGTRPVSLGPEERYHLDAFNDAQFNARGDGILTVDVEGRVVFSDRVMRQRLEIHPGSFIGEPLPLLWPRIEEVMRGGGPVCDLAVERMGGRFGVTVTAIRKDDRTVGVVCVFVEKDELEAATRQLRYFEELTRELHTIVNSASEGLWICDGDGTVLRINPASERINRVGMEEVVGHNVRDLASRGVMDCSVTFDVMESRSVIHRLATRNECKLIVTGRPVLDEEGNLIRVVVTERDISEIDGLQRQIEAQEELRGQIQHHLLQMQQIELAASRIISKSPCMIKTVSQAIKVAASDSATLLLGESGVGKGIFAELIHKQSARAQKPLITINCGSIPESLIESELFGHEKGAYTGAQSTKPGYLEMADGGILFLDEVAELPLTSQVKLLRFLEDGRLIRLGGTTARTIDVRILAATHRDLEQMVKEKSFRLDLYYRLKVIPLTIPPLRERRDCIVPLIRHYIDHFSTRNNVRKRLSRAALDALVAYHYPGNVRELINICERLVVMTDTATIDLEDLPSDISACTETEGFQVRGWPADMTLQATLESVEKSLLLEAVRRYGNQYLIAEALGVNQSTIARKLKKYGIE
ncbi:MAG: sigma 54-interacting transcriptional regulator [Syntrophobacteraceae bacterium]